MEGDISNKTIVVLVVLTVLISVLSTLVVLNEISNVKIPEQANVASAPSGENGAKLSFRIIEKTEPVQGTAMVSFGIVGRGK